MTTASTLPQSLDLVVYSGDINRVLFALTSGGEPVDLTGATLTAQARADRKMDTPVGVQATVDPVDLPHGRFALEWDGEDLRALVGDAGSWPGVWDLEIDTGSGARTVVGGLFTAVADVTRVEA